MSLLQKLDQITARYAELQAALSGGALDSQKFVAASKEYADLGPLVRTHYDGGGEPQTRYEFGRIVRVDLDRRVRDPSPGASRMTSPIIGDTAKASHKHVHLAVPGVGIATHAVNEKQRVALPDFLKVQRRVADE